MQCKVTPEMFWQFRRAQLGGKSAVTGQELPKTLAECNAAVQADHYSQACYAFASYELSRASVATWLYEKDTLMIVEVPRDVTSEIASDIRHRVIQQLLTDHGLA